MRLPLALFLFALAVRAIPLGSVFTERGMLPGGLSDEFYHLRSIGYSTARFPDFLAFDRYVNFPDGAYVHLPPAFDWVLAGVARLLTGPDDPSGMEHVVGWAPPVIGALAVALTAVVGRATFGAGAGLVAGLLLAILPAHFNHSRLGAVDHHVAVGLAAIALLAAGTGWLRSPPRGAARSVGLGLAMGLPFLMWPGFLLHVALTEAVLVAATLAAATRGLAVERARSLAIAHAVACAVVLPLCLGPTLERFGAWSPLVLSRFQPVWLAAAALTLAAAALLWARTAAGTSRLARAGCAFGLGAAGVAGALAFVPGLVDALAGGASWFSDDDFNRHAAELTPLPFHIAAMRFSLLFFLFPFAFLAVGWDALRRRGEDRLLVLAWALGFLVLALDQRRFMNTLSIPFSLVWGGAAALALPMLRERLAGRRGPILAASAAGVLLLAFVLQPVARNYAPPVRKSLAGLREPKRVANQLSELQLQRMATADWLAGHTPPTRGFLDPSLIPEYGVLTSWDAGHLTRYRARRPLVQDNFGVYAGAENLGRAWSYYAATDEADAIAILDALRVRYVVAHRMGAGSRDPYGPATMTHRLARLFGSGAQVSLPEQGASVYVPALQHHRLLFHFKAGRDRSFDAPPPHWAAGVWEVVPGARVTGAAMPGERVTATLELVSQAGRRHQVRAHADADADGRYAFVLPYPTDVPFSPSMRVAGPYRLEAGTRSAPLAVPEAAVQAGAPLAAPALTEPRSDVQLRHGAVPERG